MDTSVELGAPMGLSVQAGWQTALVISQFAIAIVIGVFVLRRSSAATRSINLQLLAAGALAFLMEAMADRLLLIWHPAIGQWTVFSAFGHHVPLWVPGVFCWAFGGQAVWMLTLLRRGASGRELWRLYALFAFTDLLFEMPPLWFDVYSYFGDQPLTFKPWLPMPLYLPFGNAIVPVFAAIAAHAVERSPRLSRLPLAAIPLTLTAMFAGLITYAWPVALSLNSDASTAVRWLCALLSIAISLAVMQLVADHAASTA